MPIKHSHRKGVLSYYGGEYHLLSKILPLIPPHIIYTEVFFGGGSLYFAKEPAKIEVINDSNKLLINFYKVVKRNFRKLKRVIGSTVDTVRTFFKENKDFEIPDLDKEVTLN